MRTEKTRTVLFGIAHTHSAHGTCLVVKIGKFRKIQFTANEIMAKRVLSIVRKICTF